MIYELTNLVADPDPAFQELKRRVSYSISVQGDPLGISRQESFDMTITVNDSITTINTQALTEAQVLFDAILVQNGIVQ